MQKRQYAGMISVFRSSKEPFQKGDTIRLPGVQITVLQTNGYAPTRVELRVQNSLDDKRYCFFKFEEGLLVRVTPPAEGDSIAF